MDKLLRDELLMFLKPLFYIFILFSALILAVFQLSWTPHYPAKAKIFFQPQWVLIQSPINGIVTQQPIPIGAKIVKGQEIIRIQTMDSLIYQSAIDEQLKSLQQQLKSMEQERQYQFSLLEHLSHLAKKKIFTVQELHEKQQQYQKILNKKQKLLQKLKELKHQNAGILQSPVTGTLAKYYVREGETLAKDKKIILIKPKKFQYWVRLKLPIALQHHVFIEQKIHMSWAGLAPLKAYPIHAVIREISPWVQHDCFVVKAEILNADDFSQHLWEGLSLDAYLLGHSHPLIQWIGILLKGVS